MFKCAVLGGDESVVWNVTGNENENVSFTQTVNGGVGTITITGVKPCKGQVGIEVLSEDGSTVYASCTVDVLVSATGAKFEEGSAGSLTTKDGIYKVTVRCDSYYNNKVLKKTLQRFFDIKSDSKENG